MLILKANPELKEIFSRLIKTMEVPVSWGDVFVILNNNLILAGDVRSLIFNYEEKRAYTNILELPLEDKEIEQLPKHVMLTNLFNMTLYAFGKWNTIKGVTVDKDYAALNKLFQNILKELRIEPSFRDDNFRFYKAGVQVTYEEVISDALMAVKVVTPEPEEDKEETGSEEDYGLGLWHNMCWKEGTYAFIKEGKNESDKAKSRIGHNFYMVDYVCPDCGEKMYMTVYPEDKDVLIEAEEARIYLARIYTCNTCNCFYTPKPGKLLGEREVYFLAFEDDRIAYEDYLEHMGRHGERISSNRMNEYEVVQEVDKEIEDADAGYSEEADNVKEERESTGKTNRKSISHLNEGKERQKRNPAADHSQKHEVHPTTEHGPHQNRESHNQENDVNQNPKTEIERAGIKRPANVAASKQNMPDFSMKTVDDLKTIIKRMEKDDTYVPIESRRKDKQVSPQEYLEAAKSQLKERLKSKYDARLKMTSRMTDRQLVELKKQIQGEDQLPEEAILYYVNTINEALTEKEKTVIRQKADAGKSKTYAELSRAIEEIESQEGPKEEREAAVRNLKQMKKERGKQEVAHLMNHLPLHMDRKQCGAYLEKLNQYEDVDITSYQPLLEQKRNMAEKEEIAALVKRGGNKDREAWNDLYDQLEKQDFSIENVKPYLEKIHDKIHALDEAAVAKICPNIRNASFAEGLAAYEKIKDGLFLPEIKTNTLEMIRMRLTKIKTDENLQLVRKLKKEIEDKIKDFSRVYFYEARQFQGSEPEEKQKESEKAVINCALNSYAADRDEFEFPLLICDSSRKGSGRKGFLLTPDHIYYRDLLDTDRIDIMDIEQLEYERSKLKKGIYVKLASGGKEKLPNGIQSNEKGRFVEILNEFVSYLQDKPESRNIDYLVEEEHEIICCFRCGYTYEGGDVCPKCGNKVNK